MNDNKLFINLATKRLQIGLEVSDKLYITEISDCKKALELTMDAINDLVNKHNLSLKNINYFYCLLGPGSNTGLRLALTIPKTIIAFNPNVKLFGINTLDLFNFSGDISLLSDRKDSVFIKTKDDATINKLLLNDLEKTNFKDSKLVIDKYDDTLINRFPTFNFIKINVVESMHLFQKSFKEYTFDDEDFLPNYSSSL